MNRSRKNMVQRLKTAVIKTVDSHQKELVELSLKIHANPEILFQEFDSSRLLADYLQNNEFKVDYGAYELDTAFKASISGGTGPRIAIVAEYDAIPEVGHGCGHNIIGTAAVGAGIALASIIKELGATVTVFGAPAEEGGNGKKLMADRGAFDDIDAAMMIHPWNGDFIYSNSMAALPMELEYFGKKAHPAHPEKGINALDAMLVGFTAYKTLLPVLPAVNPGVIIKGADTVLWVPDHSTAQFIVTGRDDTELEDARERILNCFRAGAIATGARLEFRYDWENRYRANRVNHTIGEIFSDNMRLIRANWDPPAWAPHSEIAVTDMGSVSQMVPSIHAWIAILESDLMMHSIEAAAAACSDIGHKAMLDGAKAMAMTAIDLIQGPDLLEKARNEFKRGRK
jgi:amidohydrolase